MIRHAILTASVAAAVALGTTGGRADEPKTFDDATFLKAAAAGGLYDACVCDLVGSQTRNPAVRKFAACVVASRIVGSSRLKDAAKDAGVELPAALDDHHKKRFETFKEYRGTDLERDFVKAMAQRHALGVMAFAQASKEAQHPAVRKFAADTLPALQKHLEMAKELDK
jgi:putative membrane protein